MFQTTENPTISVIIPAYNMANSIGQCLAALKQQSRVGNEDYEVIVVDDGSNDETKRIVEETGARVIRHEKRQGAAAARNTGIRAARGSWICFTDADCVPSHDWIYQITQPLKQPEIAGSKGIYASEQREIVARFVQLEYEDKYDRMYSQERINFVDTYSAAYRKQVLLANKGFDEQIAYVEDQELSFRLASRGYQLVFQPKAIVFHQHSHTVPAYFRKKYMIGYWKAQIIRRFPERAVKDSHTPQVLKLQMILMALAIITAVAIPFWILSSLLFIATIALIIATTTPFVRKAMRKDPTVALVSPLLLILRALALGLGYAYGLILPKKSIAIGETTITGWNYIFKQGMDIIGGSVGLAVTLIVSPFVAVLIKLDSPGPIIFKQERIGKGGKPFIVYKFRSMYTDAEQQLEGLINLDELSEPVFKLEEDPRMTRVGKILRRWSLDELPQFWNVLKGDMSLVGPRPEESRIVAKYSDWHRRRLAVKPGISGPMQVNGRADLSLDDRVRLEIDYIEHYSIWRDFSILIKTLPAVIGGAGAR